MKLGAIGLQLSLLKGRDCRAIFSPTIMASVIEQFFPFCAWVIVVINTFRREHVGTHYP